VKRVLLWGNEAIARGAYEYGVQVAMGYPGTPGSRVLENVTRYNEIYAGWSTNDKVAMGAAIRAAYARKRSTVPMKSVGMNVATDSSFYAVCTGVGAGLVTVVVDDPGMFSPQNEQDNRQYARFAKMPVLEPSDIQDAKDFVRAALGLSEESDHARDAVDGDADLPLGVTDRAWGAGSRREVRLEEGLGSADQESAEREL
jgi:indolepyruvate ferredoxin oxidoreductase alpha subunit